MKNLLVIAIALCSFTLQDNESKLIGRWRLIKNETFEKVLKSPGFKSMPLDEQLRVKKQFETMLDVSYYEYKPDSVSYIDMNGLDVVIRQATWSLSGDTINYVDASRDYFKQALIRSISRDSLVVNLLIQGKAGDSELIYIRDSKK